MGHCWTKIKNLCPPQPSEQSTNDDTKPDLAGGNVRLITTMEKWGKETSEANKDGKVEFSSTWDIKATPTFFFLRDGRQLDKLVGANKAELQKKTIAIAD